MSEKFKHFSDLSLRQKRRRISILRGIIDVRTQRTEALPISRPSTSGSSSHFLVTNQFHSNTENSNFNNNENNHEEEVALQDNGTGDDDVDEDVANDDDDDGGDDDDVDNGDVDDSDGNDDSSGISSSEEEIVNVDANPLNAHKRILKNAFLAANLKHTQGNIILRSLREPPFNLHYFPKDTRTILSTPTLVASRMIQNIAGGEYLHIGFRKTLMKKLNSIPENMLPDVLEIDLSTDGARIHYGLHELWPHQYRIFNIADKRPITAGIFKGQHKPSNPFDFYDQLLQEISEIQEEGGIRIRNRLITLVVRSYIADAPARAFALNHYGHNSANACSKCKVVGHCEVPGYPHTLVFEGIKHAPRTDEEYEALTNEDHHKGRSPLAPFLPLVKRVPFEPMHLVYIGNVKKVLTAHVNGKFGFRRLNGRKLNIFDSRMELLKSYCPSEFNRQPNKITMLHTFKATEFRQILLYISPAVLKDIFTEERYQHFMILHCTCRLLASEETPREMFPFCQAALESYVTLCGLLYGREFLSYNVHGLLHLTLDVETLGSLDSFSAFPFENNMPEMRKCIRKPHLSLQQIYKRLCEKDYNTTPFDDNVNIRITQPHAEGPLLEDFPCNVWQQFHNLEVGKFKFATSLRDSCCALNDSRICLIKNIVNFEEQTFFIVQCYRTVSSMYDIGVSSDVVGVYNCSNLSDRLEAADIKDVKSKVYRMPKWSSEEGKEEEVIEDEWICVTLVTPIVWP